MDRIFVVFLPYLLGLMWRDPPGLSIALSSVGSFFIAGIAQTRWFRQSGDNLPITHRLLRPGFMFHLFFVAYHVVGAGFYALNAAGFGFFGRDLDPLEDVLKTIAVGQAWMLLAHASVTAGIKLVGFRYGPPKYVIRSIPPYSLIVVSLIALGVGTVSALIPGLWNLSQKLLDISATAILVEFALSVRRRRFINMAVTFLLLGINLTRMMISGWRGLVLFSGITLAALLYPLMPRRVVIGGSAFVLIWFLFLYPLGTLLRPLLWYVGVGRSAAVTLSLEPVLSMSLEERLEQIWGGLSGRANDMDAFGKYLEFVPGNRPYYGVELVKESMFGLVPRILWPGKPDLEQLSMERVYEAGVVPRESLVSAKSNFFQDAYLSGGGAGIVIACLLLGMLIMVISRTCERWFGGYDIGTCVIYVSLFGTTINMPSNFVFFVGGAWTSYLLMVGLLILGRARGWIVPARPGDRHRRKPLLLALIEYLEGRKPQRGEG
ncbi:MAG: hypothetical protein HYY65_09485 [Candidatus Tectomicrobia bacterium]|uniref:Oligosaccharide repeat unit polymerase n=1 Tax=Tectimicrobiota bacterium TaxID=2528274 RepID=A0A932GQZ2_UNCTE|nr:hypothetical protein [Candidatus Tectomicrobia bacterium]